MKNNKKSSIKNKNIKGKIGSEGGYYIEYEEVIQIK